MRIGDLGQSKQIDEKLTSFVGTKFYFSPEMVNKQEYTAKTDVWLLKSFSLIKFIFFNTQVEIDSVCL